MVDLIEPQDFVRGKGAPVVEEVIFHVPEAGAATLDIANGLTGARVSSAVVWLNGVQVLTPANFNQQVGHLVVPVSVRAGDNSLKVELRSKPGSSLTAFVSAPVDTINLLPIPAPVQKDVDSLACSAVVSALGIPAAGIPITFSVAGFDGVVPQVAETDASGTAAVVFAPFAVAGVGVVTAQAGDAEAGLVDSETFEVTQPTSSPRAITLTQSASMLNVTMGSAQPVSFQVNLSGVAGQPTHVVFSQQIIPALGGIAISSDYPVSGWQATTDSQWQVSASISGLLPGVYFIQTTATIVETAQSASAEMLVMVPGGGGPVPPTPFGF
ncbi:MAG: hypothetical protein QM813_11065 [Verrucomicrobiota bacterium]